MRTVCIALVQFDAKPEAVSENLEKMIELIEKAVQAGARWVMFHEGTLCDYTPRLAELAEPVPEGAATKTVINAARAHNCFISFGLSENKDGKYYISQVFAGPEGFIYCYRKSWLFHDKTDTDYRDEWTRYDTGGGPELFEFDGVHSTCFICADGEAKRCIERARNLNPELVFYPNNRARLPEFRLFGERAAQIGAPMLVTNRTGHSWNKNCMGGCVIYSSTGEVLAKANREGREEMLLCDLPFGPASIKSQKPE